MCYNENTKKDEVPSEITKTTGGGKEKPGSASCRALIFYLTAYNNRGTMCLTKERNYYGDTWDDSKRKPPEWQLRGFSIPVFILHFMLLSVIWRTMKTVLQWQYRVLVKCFHRKQRKATELPLRGFFVTFYLCALTTSWNKRQLKQQEAEQATAPRLCW